jgi:hypothetical protein
MTCVSALRLSSNGLSSPARSKDECGGRNSEVTGAWEA